MIKNIPPPFSFLSRVRNLPMIALIIFGGAAPLLLPSIQSQLAFLWIFVVFALTWNLQGGQMGYNSFGNIFFSGLGMYIAVAVQIALFFNLGEWTEAGGENTFAHTPQQYFIGLFVGLAAAAILPPLAALLFGELILAMRGHYFAICTLGLGAAAGEIASGIDIIGAGGGMSAPLWPDSAGGIDARNLFFGYLCFITALGCMFTVGKLRRTRFGLALNAIRDDEDKAEAMGLLTTRYKIISWMISAFFLGIAGALFGHLNGFIDPTEVAFAGATFGVYMVLMAVLGGKGTLWGPVVGAIVFHLFQELFWAYFPGLQRVLLGLLIVFIVVFFPRGITGWLSARKKSPANSEAI